MSRYSKEIRRRVVSLVAILSVVLIIAKPLYAQQPPSGGEPPEGGAPNDRMEADSVKEDKIRKPLESYFFNDSIRALNNFAWNIDKEYNKIYPLELDTTLATWRIDYPFYKEGVGDMALGGLGQSSQPINYFLRKDYRDFLFVQTFDAYLYDMENVSFTNLKHPFTQFNYTESGQKSYREVNFGIIHAHNISPTTGFKIDYKTRGTKGLYAQQDTENKNLALTFSHTGKFYSLHAGYIHNKMVTEENGGVVGAWAIRDTTYEMTIGIPTKLADASAMNTYRNTSIFVDQSIGLALEPVTDMDFSLSNLSTLYLGHSFEYNRWSKLYTDVYSTYTDDRSYKDAEGNYVPEQKEYYDNWYINPVASRDTLFEQRVSNRVYVQAQPWNRDGVVGTINGGVGLDLHTYSQFGLNSYLTGETTTDKRTSYFAYGSLDGKIKRYADWGADIKFYPSGYRGGDYNASAHIALKAYVKDKPMILSGAISTQSSTPSYWQENLFSNHFVWFTPLDKENKSRLEAKFEVPSLALEVSAWQEVTTNKIYYDANSIVAQSGDLVSVSGLYARKDFRYNGFHLDHRVLMQWSTDQQVVPLPLFSAYLSYYYEFWAKENILRMQIGVDGRYTSSYYMPGYNPALSTFYNQREVEIGDYPYVDLYLMAKWKRMRIFLKYQHVNDGLFGNGNYFQVADYPLNPGMFKIGISWGFYD
ncbi:MAG: putative porin [Rikenellaceae bacterium]